MASRANAETDENLARLERDLNLARESLYQTFDQVHQKVENVGSHLPHPRRVVRRNPMMWVAGAMATGVLAGLSRSWGDRVACLLMGAFFGTALSDYLVQRNPEIEV
jgi:ElaB/YqjD/DUF883 family membrane-anchored ribosome-binding protein